MIEKILGKYALRLGMTNNGLDEYAGIDFQRTEIHSNISTQQDTEADMWENEDMRLPKSFLFTSICQHIML